MPTECGTRLAGVRAGLLHRLLDRDATRLGDVDEEDLPGVGDEHAPRLSHGRGGLRTVRPRPARARVAASVVCSWSRPMRGFAEEIRRNRQEPDASAAHRRARLAVGRAIVGMARVSSVGVSSMSRVQPPTLVRGAAWSIPVVAVAAQRAGLRRVDRTRRAPGIRVLVTVPDATGMVRATARATVLVLNFTCRAPTAGPSGSRGRRSSAAPGVTPSRSTSAREPSPASCGPTGTQSVNLVRSARPRARAALDPQHRLRGRGWWARCRRRRHVDAGLPQQVYPGG